MVQFTRSVFSRQRQPRLPVSILDSQWSMYQTTISSASGVDWAAMRNDICSGSHRANHLAHTTSQINLERGDGGRGTRSEQKHLTNLESTGQRWHIEGNFKHKSTRLNPLFPVDQMSILQDIESRAGPHEAEEPGPAFRDGSDLSVILDSIPANVAILDCKGLILRVNEAWNCFTRENGIIPDTVGVGANYLSVCDLATGADSEAAEQFASGIRAVISGITDHFVMEYPCHSPTRKRWFMGHVTPIPNMAPAAIVVAHVDITLQKLGEEKIRILNEELEFRVVERTTELCAAINALEKQVNQRRELEQEILNIAERETLRVGQDLHDGLCQTLSGVAFITRALQRKLQQGTLNPAAASRETGKIVHLLIEAIKEARGLASGMFPANIEEFGLGQVLKQFAAHTSDRFHIRCKFISNGPVVIPDYRAAIHVYRIAQEAVSNAIRHGDAKLVLIKLSTAEELITLRVADNGSGRIDDTKKNGMGLNTMKYRARVIGGRLEIQQRRQHGLTVVCSFPTEQKPE